ncbi:MAG TPA: hypothetical protein VMT70_20820 [Vicinamibacteria bacterium]|nr:hypothetical protein [Vicinamibacteria bacterium]
MTLRAVVLPLGFGLSAVLCTSSSARGTPEDEGGKPRPPVRVYTNADLDRVRPFRDETGVRSVPAAPAGHEDARSSPHERARARGESYWRREAERVRERVRSMETQAAELRAEIAERSDDLSHLRTRGHRSPSVSTSPATLGARLAALERRMREIQDDLAERARREGALPGWLR